MTGRLGKAAAALALGLLAAPALADTAPSRWERAKDARIGEDWELHVRVCAFLAFDPREGSAEQHRKEEAALAWLEEAHAETSTDVRLRFDLGEVYEQLKHHQRAVDVLAPALAQAPDHPAAPEAWIELAYAYAYLDRSREELVAYDAYLLRASTLGGRATALMNRAEAQMRLGNLEDAVTGYRDAIAVAESVSGVENLFNDDVLARWGLAVALDRSGDATGGAREAAVAAQLDPGRGAWPRGSIIANEKPNVSVFFVPAYEGSYYIALGMAEHAKQAVDPRTAVSLWRKTELYWSQYIAGAEQWDLRHKDRPDRWLPHAKAHLATAQRHRAAAEARARGR